MGLHSRKTIATYEVLRIAVSGWEGRYQAHHIVEAQVLRMLGHDVNTCPAVILTEAEHKAITAKLRLGDLEPSNLKYMDVSKKEILEAYEQAYADRPLWLDVVRPYFK
jgi:hypothetical protein